MVYLRNEVEVLNVVVDVVRINWKIKVFIRYGYSILKLVCFGMLFGVIISFKMYNFIVSIDIENVIVMV